MPLRARVKAQMLPYSTAAQLTVETDDVLFRTVGAVREITLNRPRKLNAVNPNIVDAITPRLLEYAKSDLAGIVVLKGAGGKALSAGGDVAALALNARSKGLEEGGSENAAFFRREFGLNHLIGTYSKPYVALMDGVTMGGGVGLSVHGSFRVATEKTLFAMPETTIGYYPDVGGLWFLSKLGGDFGLYMALTSARISGYDAYRLGLATHYVASERLPELEARLSELEPQGHSTEAYFSLVNTALEDFNTEPPLNYQPGVALENCAIIEECFKYDQAEEIVRALRQNGSKFAVETADVLEQRSPTSVKVALALYRRLRHVDFHRAFKEEIVVCDHFCRNPNFVEGVIALLVEKRKANWDPSTLEQVTSGDVRRFFEPISPNDPVAFTNDATFHEYPHQFGLPTQRDIELYVTGETAPFDGKVTRQDVIQHFQSRRGDKPGLEEHIDEILRRKTRPDSADASLLDWNY